MIWLIDDPLSRFIAQTVAVLVTARLLGRVARRIGQPLVVAEIVAGIVLGPSVLGWLAPPAASWLFPAGSLESMRMASQLGLVLFVFLIGLELDPEMLRGRLRASLAVSIGSISLPFVLGSMLAVFLGAFAGPGGVTLAFALFLGAAMSITAFPVLARILAEHGLLRTRIGALALACAAIDDAIAWCVLAFVVALTRAGGLGDALVTTALSIGFVAAMLFVVRPLLGRLVDRISAPLTLTHDIVTAVIIAMLVSAWITEWIGIHLVFGAFAFGAVLPKRDGFARALSEKLEDLVVVMLLPLFFAISGLRTNIDVVISADHLVACGAIVLVASTGKFGGSALVARLTGLPWRDAGALGVLMNTRGLMELIVINIGFELGVISSSIFSMMVVMVLVTTIATAPILRRIYPPREAMRDLLAAEPRTKARAGHRIMACISHDRVGPSLVAMAHALAGGGGETIALHLARVDDRAALAAEPPDATKVLEPALARAVELGLAARPLAFGSVDVAEDIIRVADIRDVDMVLLGLHQPLLSQALLGSVVHQVLRHAAGTVAIHVDRGMRGAPARVLVPVLGSRHDRTALEVAGRIQRATGAEITVFQVAAPAGEATDEAIRGFEDNGRRVSVETAPPASPAAVIERMIDRSRDFDLVVVGVGRQWGPRPNRAGPGLQPERLIRDCASSVLIVRGPIEQPATPRIEED
jgi:Kef-type K+ transport system membrane component KefB